MAGMPDRAYLQNVFNQVDKDRSGAIDSMELQAALSNGNWTPFNPDTIRLMIGMFDKKGTGTVTFDEFGSLWKYVTDWQQCFRSFDRDNSGSINKQELKTAITTFGYRFSDQFYDVLMKRFDRTNKGGVHFDDFIQCSIVLHMLTPEFRQHDQLQNGSATFNFEQFILATLTQAFSHHDQDRDGVITLSYEQFLHMVFSLRV